MFKGQKGITLVALVITIIVLLILAGVALATLNGNNNIIDNANKAVTKYNENAAADNQVIVEMNKLLEQYLSK